MIKGVGYTGADALYNMLADTYVVPVRGLQGKQRFFNVLKLLKQRKVTFCEAVYLMQHEKVTEDERRVLKLVMQTPLSVAELIRCFENSVRDVSSADNASAFGVLAINLINTMITATNMITTSISFASRFVLPCTAL